jgi:hypothetical protein
MAYHIIFLGFSERMKFFTPEGTLKHEIEAHGSTVGSTDSDPYGHDGKCPPGDYYLGAPQPCAPPQSDVNVPYGEWFTGLVDAFSIWPLHDDRMAIGVHGGGTGAPGGSFAPLQGWVVTDGCIRLQNQDNDGTFVPFVKFAQADARFKDNPSRAVLFTVDWTH